MQTWYKAADLTPAQLECVERVYAGVQDSERLLVLWYGGIRLGKSTGAALSLLGHSIGRNNPVYTIGAYTQGQCVEIYEPKLELAAELLDMPTHMYRGAYPRMEIGNAVFFFRAGGEEGRDKRIQGTTWDGLILDELPLLNKQFVMQCEARVSAPGALRIYTANKSSPYHWTTKHYWDRAKKGEIQAYLLDTNEGNKYVDAAFFEEREKEYTDENLDRFIHNRFALDARPLYGLTVSDCDTAGWKADITVCCSLLSQMSIMHVKRFEGRYIIFGAEHVDMPVSIDDIPWGDDVYVNDTNLHLAKALRATGVNARVYATEHKARHIELTQVMATGETIQASDFPGIENLVQAVDEYSTPGIYRDRVVKCLEILADMVDREII